MNGQVMGGQRVVTTVQLAGAGDEVAFAQLVAAYHADMARVAFVACGDRELAEDAVQSAWLVAWRKLHSLRDPDRVRPWLLSVTANEARQIVRRRRGPVIEIDVEAAGDPRGDPSDGIERLDLRRALAHLSPTTEPCSPCTTSSTSARTSSGRPSARRRPRPVHACPGPWIASGRSSAMAERDRFERDLGTPSAPMRRMRRRRSARRSWPGTSPRCIRTGEPRSVAGVWWPSRAAPGPCSC